MKDCSPTTHTHTHTLIHIVTATPLQSHKNQSCWTQVTPQTNFIYESSVAILKSKINLFDISAFSMPSYLSSRTCYRLIDFVKDFTRMCSPMVRETGVQSQVRTYQILLKWHLIPLSLTLSIKRYVSRVKRSNPGKGVAPSPTPRCSSY